VLGTQEFVVGLRQQLAGDEREQRGARRFEGAKAGPGIGDPVRGRREGAEVGPVSGSPR
jgi:hypothetical protein